LSLPLAAAIAMPAVAQPAAPIDQRVGKLEKEMKAVQRTVFPQGTPVEPELSSAPPTATPTGVAASMPITDLTSRVDALEKQVAALTGTSEQNGYKIKQLEAALAAIQSRLTTLEGGATPASETGTGGPSSSLSTETPTAAAPIRSGPATVKITPPTPAAASKPAPVKSDPARKAAVAAIEMPSTGDAAEDDYTYGFRLYTAKLYPEAQVKLKAFTEKYPPTAKRWSYAKNLLGRAYLDEGKPALASVAFYDNYQKAPRGERAADSLTWLGQSLIRLKKLPDACKVFDELDDVYAGKLTADQKARAAKGRADAKCAI
jgi:TolA-binding protein